MFFASPPLVQVQQLQAEIDVERKCKETAQQNAERLQHDKEELKVALYQLQESLKSSDPSGQIEEMVRQARSAQEGTRDLEARIAELQQTLEMNQKESLAYKQEVRRTRKQLEETETRLKVGNACDQSCLKERLTRLFSC